MTTLCILLPSRVCGNVLLMSAYGFCFSSCHILNTAECLFTCIYELYYIVIQSTLIANAGNFLYFWSVAVAIGRGRNLNRRGIVSVIQLYTIWFTHNAIEYTWLCFVLCFPIYSIPSVCVCVCVPVDTHFPYFFTGAMVKLLSIRHLCWMRIYMLLWSVICLPRITSTKCNITSCVTHRPRFCPPPLFSLVSDLFIIS